MIKYLHDFTIEPRTRTCYCDFWVGRCYYKGQWYSIERGFYGYPKREIKKSLHDTLVKYISGLES